MNDHTTEGTTEQADVMIVGSGFGGAVAALRLTRHGVRTVLLERGRRWPLLAGGNTFSTLQNPDGRSAWLSNVALLGPPKPIERSTGVLELTAGKGIATFSGAGVGGGSLVFAGVLLQPPAALFKRIFGPRVDPDEMRDVHFRRVRSVIKPGPLPRDILANPEYAAARAWLRLGSQAGLKAELADLALDFHAVKEELQGRRTPSVIAGEFWYGNNSGAKLSLDRNYFRLAEDSGRLDVVTHHNVTSVRSRPDGRYLVTADQIDGSGSVLGQRRYVVRKLFLAAGSVQTPKLLVRAKARGWLPRLNDAVGTRWGNNGDIFSALDGLAAAPPVLPNRGGTAPVLIQHLDNPVSPIIVECFADWARDGQRGVVASLGMSPSPGKGRFTYEAATDSVVLNWPADDPEIRRAIKAGEVTYERLAKASGYGREPVRALAYGMRPRRTDAGPGTDTTPIDATATAHPLGGVPLDAATDNVGTVRNYPGLYVIDGSLVPGNTGSANPAMTIAALAERNIDRIIQRDFA